MKITDGSTAQHQYLVELINALPSTVDEPWNVSEGDLSRFWDRVEAAGTPLLTAHEDGVMATFVWRDHPERDVDMVEVALTNFWRPLALLAGTDVWYVDIELPTEYASEYRFHLGFGGVIQNEDDHEPWPMSFGDPFNRWPIQAEDSVYPRNIVRARGLSKHEPLHGNLRHIDIPALLLGGPRLTATFAVEIYEPPISVTNSDASFPLVILLNGQFIESSDALHLIDQAIHEGSLAPFLLVIPGSVHGVDDHTAWGWRNGYGPHNLADHLARELVPAVAASYELTADVHLVAWRYTAYAAVQTAASSARIRSLTLLNPIGVTPAAAPTASRRPAPRPGGEIGIDQIANDLQPVLESGCVVLLSEPVWDGASSEETPTGELARRVDAAIGRKVDRIPLTNFDLVAGASVLLPALTHVLGSR